MHMLTTFLVNVTCKDVYIQVIKNKILVYSISHDTALYRKNPTNCIESPLDNQPMKRKHL